MDKILIGIVIAFFVWLFGTVAVVWIQENGVGSFIGMMVILFGYVIIKVALGGGSTESPDDEITVIDNNGKSTRYTKKD